MQTDHAHEAVHDEGGAGHVARVFEQGEEEVQDEQSRHEDQHPAHAGDDPVNEKGAKPAGARVKFKRNENQFEMGPVMIASVQSKNGEETSITSRKTMYMTAKKMGSPSHLWVTILSI